MVRRAIGAVGIIALAAIGVIWWSGLRTENPSAAAQTAPQAIPVSAGTVAAAVVPVFLQGIGTVQAYNMVAIKSRVDGQIVKVDFKEGQDVKTGDPLFQIDPRPFQAALRGDEAQIDNAKLNLGYADIRAPIDGRAGARLVDKGNLLRAGDNNTLVTISEIKPIFVSLTLPQEALYEIRENHGKAPLIVQAYSGDGKKQLAEGKLTMVDNAVDQATGTIRLKARFDNEEERLWPGAFVSV